MMTSLSKYAIASTIANVILIAFLVLSIRNTGIELNDEYITVIEANSIYAGLEAEYQALLQSADSQLVQMEQDLAESEERIAEARALRDTASVNYDSLTAVAVDMAKAAQDTVMQRVITEMQEQHDVAIAGAETEIEELRSQNVALFERNATLEELLENSNARLEQQLVINASLQTIVEEQNKQKGRERIVSTTLVLAAGACALVCD